MSIHRCGLYYIADFSKIPASPPSPTSILRLHPQSSSQAIGSRALCFRQHTRPLVNVGTRRHGNLPRRLLRHPHE